MSALAAMAAYCFVVGGLVGLPEASGRPAAIHCNVRDTGLDPTCTYTPSSGGLNFPYWVFPASESGGKSTTISAPFTPETGYSPTPKPARVNAIASALAASPSLANNCWVTSSGSHALYDPGDITLTPSCKLRPISDRLSSIISGCQPNFERTIAISFARFWASGSLGTTWIKILVPTHLSNPANHFLAGGSWSSPNNPTCRGSSTFCSARLSACNCAVSLFNAAMRSPLDLDSNSRAFWATSATLYSTYADNAESTKPLTPTIAPKNNRRTPHKSQNSIGEPQSIDRSLVVFAMATLISALSILATMFFLFKASRVWRR